MIFRLYTKIQKEKDHGHLASKMPSPIFFTTFTKKVFFYNFYCLINTLYYELDYDNIATWERALPPQHYRTQSLMIKVRGSL